MYRFKALTLYQQAGGGRRTFWAGTYFDAKSHSFYKNYKTPTFSNFLTFT